MRFSSRASAADEVLRSDLEGWEPVVIASQVLLIAQVNLARHNERAPGSIAATDEYVVPQFAGIVLPSGRRSAAHLPSGSVSARCFGARCAHAGLKERAAHRLKLDLRSGPAFPSAPGAHRQFPSWAGKAR